MKRFTFKREKYAPFGPRFVQIKLGRKQCGTIHELRLDGWEIAFQVRKEPTKDEPAPFRWARLTKKFDNESQARAFIKEKNDEIQEKFDIFLRED